MINLYGSVGNLGYSLHNLNILKALIENGQEVNLTPIGQVELDPFYEMYFKHATSTKFDYKSPSIFCFHDNLSNQACGTPLLTWSIFETTKLKEVSRHMLENGPTDVILTTTEEHKKLLEQYNFSKPIEVINEGIDDTLFNTIPVDKYIDTKKFTYITSGKREERKNTDITIRTFINLMKEREVALICHTFNPFINNVQDHPFKNLNCWTGINPTMHGFEYKGFNGKAHLFTYKSCDIYFTTPTIPVCNVPSLIHSANVGIQISRAEGWGLPCILPGSKIITNNGIKNIENVELTDKLLSHTGKFRNIIKKMVHKNNNKTYEIKCWGNNETLKITEEHPIYGIKKENIIKYNDINNLIPEWIKAKDIKKGDIIIKSTITEEFNDLIVDLKDLDSNLLYDDTHVWYKLSYPINFKNSINNLAKKYNSTKSIIEDAINIVKNKNKTNKDNSNCTKISKKLIDDNIIFNKQIKINRFINLNDISELIGLYIAEGSNDKSKINLSLHEKEIPECLDMVKKNVKFLSDDISIWTKIHKGSKCVDISISSKIISILFEKLCGKHAKNKKIPYNILYGPIETLNKCIYWYHYGDGHTCKNIKSITTISEELSNQICIAIQKIGFKPLKNIQTGKFKFKNQKIANDVYIVYWIENFKERKIGSGNRIWKHNNNLAILVKEIKEIQYSDNVYNFEVETDNSYTLCTSTVHNCSEFLGCGLPTITTLCTGHNEYVLGSPDIQANLIVLCNGYVTADDGFWFKSDQGDWLDINIDSYVSKLEETFNDQTKYTNKSEALADYMANNYSWNKSTQKLITVIDKYRR